MLPKDVISSTAKCEAVGLNLATNPAFTAARKTLARANACMAESKILYALTSTKVSKAVQRGRVDEVLKKVDKQAEMCGESVRALMLPGLLNEANTWLLHN